MTKTIEVDYVIADRFGIEKELVLEFFCTFSRFDYALKRAGFATGDEDRVDPH